LIDPEGKIIAKDIAFDGISATLKELIRKTN
jgi:hypothetical protein